MSWTQHALEGFKDQQEGARKLALAFEQASNKADQAMVSNLMALEASRRGDTFEAQQFWQECQQLWSEADASQHLPALAQLGTIIHRAGFQLRNSLTSPIDPWSQWENAQALGGSLTADATEVRADWQQAMSEGLDRLQEGLGQPAALAFSSSQKHGDIRDILALNGVALGCFLQGDYAGACEAYEELRTRWTQCENNLEAFLFLAQEFRSRGWTLSAEALTQNRPVDPWRDFSRDLGLQMEGQSEAGPAGPTDWSEAMELGLSKIQIGSAEEALRAFSASEFLTQDPTEKCLALNGVAWACAVLGDYTQAQEAWAEMCRLAPQIERDPVLRFLEMLTRCGLSREADLIRHRLTQNEAPLIDPWRDFTPT